MNLVVLTTCADVDSARRVVAALVEERLAACVTMLPGAESCYWWEGRAVTNSEVLCVCKTTEAAWPAFQQRLKELHPYEIPEMICLPITAGWPPYLKWLSESTGAGR